MAVVITPKRGDSDPGTDDLSDGEIAIRKDVNPPKLFVRVGSNIREIGSGGGISGLGSTDNAILRANGTGGSTAQGSSLVIDDSANLTGANGITGATITASTKFVSDKLEAQNHGGSVMGFEFTDGFGSDDTIQISVGNAVRFAFVENSGTRAFIPWNDNDVNLGHSSYEFKNLYLDGTAFIDTLQLGATEITATGAELNILDGVTATASELNIMDGVTATTSELNIMDGVTATATEINKIDGYTGTTAELNYNDTGVSVGTVAASKTIVADANKDITGGRNITITGELDAATLDISGNMDLEGDIDVNGTSNLDNTDIDGTLDVSGTVSIAGEIQHTGDTNNSIAFGTDSQTFETGGTTRLDIANDGLRIGGTGARVTEIEDDDSLGTSDTKLCTQGNVKAYVDANAGGSSIAANAQASMADSKVFPLAYYDADDSIADAMPATHLNTSTDGGFFITNPENHEPELNLYRMDTNTQNTNGIAAIKFGNAAHDVDYDGDQPNVIIQAYGGRSSTNHDENTSPVVFRFRTTTYSTTSTSAETRWEMRSVLGDDHGANRGLHSGDFGSLATHVEGDRGTTVNTIPKCGSRYILAVAADGAGGPGGTIHNIAITSSGMTDLREGQVFEIFGEANGLGFGTTSVTVTADWVGAGTSTKTIATASGGSQKFGYMRCIYVNGSDYGGTSGWYGIFGAEDQSSGAINFTG